MSVYSALQSLWGVFGPTTSARGAFGVPTEQTFSSGGYSGALQATGEYRSPSAYGFESLTPEIPGLLQLSAFDASKRYELQRAEAQNELMQQFSEQSQAFGIQAMQQMQAADTFAANLENINTRLAGIRTASQTSASPASSQREYSQLATRAMQGTTRYLQELEAFRSPQAPVIDFTFKDPITGKDLTLDTRFEDIYAGDFKPGDVAREQIMGDFKRLTEEKEKEALDYFRQEFGSPEDYLAGYGSREEMIQRLEERGTTTARQYLDQFYAAENASTFARDAAEAMALAEMSGFDPFTAQRSRWSAETNTFDPSTVFFRQDVNAVLEDMISKTTERLDIARISEREDVQKEFERRASMAQQQYGLYQSQQQRNKEQEMRIEEEKQRVRQMLEQQKREYSETLGSFGDTTSQQGGGIQFADTRPM